VCVGLCVLGWVVVWGGGGGGGVVGSGGGGEVYVLCERVRGQPTTKRPSQKRLGAEISTP